MSTGHPDFEFYSVILTPEQGLCKITAVGKDIRSSSQGTEVEEEFKSKVEALTEKYGEPENKHNFLKSGSLWKERQYWMMGLLKKERIISAFWGPKKNKNLPDSIDSIEIHADATNSETAYITIAYEFDNFDSCIKTLRTKKNSSL